MKPVTPSDEMKEQINYFENRKAFKASNPEIKSKIVAFANHGSPAYFLRADYETGKDAKKTPLAYWQINNTFDAYFIAKQKKIENLKDLMRTEKRLNLPQERTKAIYKEEKKRYDFLTQVRQVSIDELNERIQEDRLVFLK